MKELMKIELKKMNLSGQTKGLVIANVVIFLIVIMLQLIAQEEASLFPTTMFIDTLVKATFLIWQAVLIANLIVEELRSKTLMQLYTYPINRKSLIQAKLVLICIIVFTFIFVTQLIQHILLLGLNSVFPLIQYHISILEIVQLFFTSVTAVMIGMFPLYIGLTQKSSVATIVSAICVVSVVTNTQGLSGGLITSLPISVMMGIIGIVFAVIAIKDVVKKDLVI